MNRRLVSALSVTILTGAVIAGCSGGGGRGGGSTSAGISPGGSLSQALPLASRAATYSFSTVQVNSVTGLGLVSAMGISAGSSQEFIVASEPLHELDLVRQTGAPVGIDSLPARATSIAIASSQGAVTNVVAVADLAAAALGDVYAIGSGGVSIFQDNDRSEAYVANADSSSLFVLSGGEGQLGDISGSGGVASFGSQLIPMAVARFKNVNYVGGVDPVNGSAKLFRVVSSAVEELAFPYGTGGGFGVRQEIVGMMGVAGTISGTSTGIELLVMAVGSFDKLNRAGGGGAVLITDGSDWESPLTFMNEAPTALAFIDNTIYVGTSGGRLMYRASDGVWQEEPNLPANDGIYSLLTVDAGTLAVGVRGKTGAQVLIRRVISGTPAPTPNPTPNPNPNPNPTPSGPKYLTAISTILAGRCTSCHTAPGVAPAPQVYPISAQANTDADFMAAVARVDVGAPANSRLLVKATGGLGHGGGPTLPAGGAEANTILQWIQGGALKQ